MAVLCSQGAQGCILVQEHSTIAWHSTPAVHRCSCLEEECLGRWVRPYSAEGSPALAETHSQTLISEAAALHRKL